MRAVPAAWQKQARASPEARDGKRRLPPPHSKLTLRVIAGSRAGVDLARAGDLLVRILEHFLPLREPARDAGDGEEDGEHFRRDAHGLVDEAGVEVDVRVELAGDEVIVFEGDALELEGDVEQRIASRDFEDLV